MRPIFSIAHHSITFLIIPQIEELAEELEEQRELATNTLQELEALNIKYRENLKKVEELQMNVCPLQQAPFNLSIYREK